MKKISYQSLMLQILLGVFVADVFTAMGHWIEDSYLDYCVDIPILRDIAKDNELHHYFPRTILSYSYLEHMTYTLPITITFTILLYLINPSIFVLYPYFVLVFFISCVISNILHRFSHMRDCENSWIVRALQKCGIICSHEHHFIHHKVGDQKYCVMIEYSNYILDTLLFWRGLEYIIYLMTGIKPKQKRNYDDYSSIHNFMHENAKLECPDKPTYQEVEVLKEKLKTYNHCKPW
jgi:ubiquitin-conjugating enzyme E2 variant